MSEQCGFCGRTVGPHDGYGPSQFSGTICGVRADAPGVPVSETCWGRLNAASVHYNEMGGHVDGIVRRTHSALISAAKSGDEALVLTLAREVASLERQRVAMGTITEHFERVERELREELRGKRAA